MDVPAREDYGARLARFPRLGQRVERDARRLSNLATDSIDVVKRGMAKLFVTSDAVCASSAPVWKPNDSGCGVESLRRRLLDET